MSSVTRGFHAFFFSLGIVAFSQLYTVAFAASLGTVVSALSDANAEARGPILTALSGILAAVVLISAAALIVRALTRQ